MQKPVGIISVFQATEESPKVLVDDYQLKVQLETKKIFLLHLFFVDMKTFEMK